MLRRWWIWQESCFKSINQNQTSWKMATKQILLCHWRTQHPFAGQNIQHLSSILITKERCRHKSSDYNKVPHYLQKDRNLNGFCICSLKQIDTIPTFTYLSGFLLLPINFSGNLLHDYKTAGGKIPYVTKYTVKYVQLDFLRMFFYTSWFGFKRLELFVKLIMFCVTRW